MNGHKGVMGHGNLSGCLMAFREREGDLDSQLQCDTCHELWIRGSYGYGLEVLVPHGGV